MKKTGSVMIAVIMTITALIAAGGICHARSILVVDADNRTCPVSGEAIRVKRFNTDYAGKRYWFSSFGAVQKFKEDPGKYISGRVERPGTRGQDDRQQTSSYGRERRFQ